MLYSASTQLYCISPTLDYYYATETNPLLLNHTIKPVAPRLGTVLSQSPNSFQLLSFDNPSSSNHDCSGIFLHNCFESFDEAVEQYVDRLRKYKTFLALEASCVQFSIDNVLLSVL